MTVKVRSNYVDTLKSFGNLGILLPLGATAPLTDLSGNARNGTAAGGVTAGGYTPGPFSVADDGATDFDGGWITTDYGTRRNLCTNPGFEIDKSGWRDVGQSGYCQNSSGVWTREASGGRRDGPCSKFVKPDDPDQFSGFEMINTATVIGQDYTVSMWLKGESGGESLHIGIGSVPTAGGSGYKTVVLTTEWERYEFTFEVLTAVSTVFMRNSNFGANGMTWYMDDVLFEQASSAGTYFDGSGYEQDGNWVSDAGGHVGWTGAEHASASDKGCFANGTTRTFSGWAYRDTSGTIDTLVGNSGVGNHFRIRLSTGQSVTAYPGGVGGGASTFTTAWPDNGEWVHWTLIFDEPGDTMTLYINGTFISTQAQTAQFALPVSGTASNLNVGVYAGNVDPFNGKMAWVSVHEATLTAGQVAAARNSAIGLVDAPRWTKVGGSLVAA